MFGKFCILLFTFLACWNPSPLFAVSLATLDHLHDVGKTLGERLNIKSLLLESLENSMEKEDELAWRLARSYYSLGQLSKQDDARKRYYSQCIDRGQEAIDLNKTSAPAYFYRGLCTGKKGEMAGIFKSLDVIEPFKKDMEKARQLNPKLEHGGPSRALSKLYLELPFFLGGSLKKSLRFAKEAVVSGPEYDENHLYLAQIYLKNDQPLRAQNALSNYRTTARDPKLHPEALSIHQQAEALKEEIATRIEQARMDKENDAYEFKN
jgi:tetratricopeptide (TPR) repeat protein